MSSPFDTDTNKIKKKRQSREFDQDIDENKKKSLKKVVCAPNSFIDFSVFDIPFPVEFENAFAAAIFELGLKHSSPKVIIPLMPNESSLNKEHIKSHLQKYRIHHQRSREEFLEYYKTYLQNQFHEWEVSKGGTTTSKTTDNNKRKIILNAKLSTSNKSDSIKQEKITSNSLRISNNNDSNNSENNNNFVNQDIQNKININSSIELLQQSEYMFEEWKKICQEVAIKGELLTNDLKNNLAVSNGRFQEIINIISTDTEL